MAKNIYIYKKNYFLSKSGFRTFYHSSKNLIINIDLCALSLLFVNLTKLKETVLKFRSLNRYINLSSLYIAENVAEQNNYCFCRKNETDSWIQIDFKEKKCSMIVIL